MAKTKIENIEDKIIMAAIESGAKNGADRINIADVASVCGISTFTVFKYYKTVKNLAAEAFAACGKTLGKVFSNVDWCVIDFETQFCDVWQTCLDNLLSNVTMTRYYESYKHSKLFNISEVSSAAIAHVRFVKHVMQDKSQTRDFSDEEYLMLWVYGVDSTVALALKIADGYFTDTEQNRKTLFQLIFGGALQITKLTREKTEIKTEIKTKRKSRKAV